VLVECDQDASWARARGWALIQGLEAGWSTTSTATLGWSPMARRVIGAALESTEKQLS
jgi:hypothetical protein